MNAEWPEGSDRDGSPPRPLPRQILVLGVISLLTAMSSAMVYGLLPVSWCECWESPWLLSV
jgi:hypothetical protein